jgi:hypothetical protein
MRSESQVNKQLEDLRSDLAHWQARLERFSESETKRLLGGGLSDAERRKILGNTICSVEGQIESLEWVLKEH